MWDVVVDVVTVAMLLTILFYSRSKFYDLNRRLDQTYADIHDTNRQLTVKNKGMWD